LDLPSVPRRHNIETKTQLHTRILDNKNGRNTRRSSLNGNPDRNRSVVPALSNVLEVLWRKRGNKAALRDHHATESMKGMLTMVDQGAWSQAHARKL
jgi:hypothetical protein